MELLVPPASRIEPSQPRSVPAIMVYLIIQSHKRVVLAPTRALPAPLLPLFVRHVIQPGYWHQQMGLVIVSGLLMMRA